MNGINLMRFGFLRSWFDKLTTNGEILKLMQGANGPGQVDRTPRVPHLPMRRALPIAAFGINVRVMD
ncbi:hypothetical protein [Methylomicrobium lacus]|uniref:hypothetical protein n=1 Tax=Methylomicrobium lacus TaxID=136992 RepID=UPI001268E6E5|nr:hypothetical protein [Methylomicrobium lacus]